MSIATLTETLDRISNAPKSSPIAVFLSQSNHGSAKDTTKRKLDSYFSDTLLTKLWIKEGKRTLVGIYHAMSGYDKTRKELRRATEQ